MAVLLLAGSLIGCEDEAHDDQDVSVGPQPDAGVDADVGFDCAGDLVDCDGQCVNLEESVEHCGKCDQQCEGVEDGSAVCTDGICDAVCDEPGDVICDNACVDAGIDLNNCGECGRQCVDEIDGTPVCVEEQCFDGCESFEGTTVCAGTCVDFSSDDNHCGGCGNACRATDRCVDEECVLRSFVVETVSESGGFSPSSNWRVEIEVDHDDRPHVVFYDSETRDVVYAQRQEGQWHFETVYEDTEMDYYRLPASLVFDSEQNPWIGFGVVGPTESTKGLMQLVAHRTAPLKFGGEWDVAPVIDPDSEQPASGYMTDIAIDDDDRIHLRYTDREEKTVKYAVGEPPEWEVHDVFQSHTGGWHDEVVVDDDGLPHLTYSAGPERPEPRFPSEGFDLMYSHYDGESWTHAVVNREDLFNRNPSIDLAEDGTPHILATTVGNAYWTFWLLMYITFDGEEWVTELIGIDEQSDEFYTHIPLGATMADFGTLRVDGEGIPHIGYTSEVANYARRVDGEWEKYVVEDTWEYSVSEPWVNITLDSRGIPHFVYEVNGAIHYATLQLQDDE